MTLETPLLEKNQCVSQLSVHSLNLLGRYKIEVYYSFSQLLVGKMQLRGVLFYCIQLLHACSVSQWHICTFFPGRKFRLFFA